MHGNDDNSIDRKSFEVKMLARFNKGQYLG